MSEDTVYAVASGKGGVGKTTITVNVGITIADLDYRVAVVDADLGMANLTDLFEASPSGATLHEVLSGDAALGEALYELAEGFVVVPSGDALESYAAVDTERLGSVVEALREAFDYVLLDVGAGISREAVLPLGLADAVVLVATPDLAAVKNVSKTADLVRRADGDIEGVVINRMRPDDSVDEGTIAANLGPHLLGTIPEDDAVRRALHSGTPVVVVEPESDAAAAYRELAGKLVASDESSHPSDPTEERR